MGRRQRVQLLGRRRRGPHHRCGRGRHRAGRLPVPPGVPGVARHPDGAHQPPPVHRPADRPAGRTRHPCGHPGRCAGGTAGRGDGVGGLHRPRPLQGDQRQPGPRDRGPPPAGAGLAHRVDRGRPGHGGPVRRRRVHAPAHPRRRRRTAADRGRRPGRRGGARRPAVGRAVPPHRQHRGHHGAPGQHRRRTDQRGRRRHVPGQGTGPQPVRVLRPLRPPPGPGDAAAHGRAAPRRWSATSWCCTTSPSWTWPPG